MEIQCPIFVHTSWNSSLVWTRDLKIECPQFHPPNHVDIAYMLEIQGPITIFYLYTWRFLWQQPSKILKKQEEEIGERKRQRNFKTEIRIITKESCSLFRGWEMYFKIGRKGQVYSVRRHKNAQGVVDGVSDYAQLTPSLNSRSHSR